MEYKIGQILTSTEDVEVEKALSNEKVINSWRKPIGKPMG